MGKVIGQELTIDLNKLEIPFISGEEIAAAALKLYNDECYPCVTLDLYTRAFKAVLEDHIQELLDDPCAHWGEVFKDVESKAYKFEDADGQKEHPHVWVDYGDEISCSRCGVEKPEE